MLICLSHRAARPLSKRGQDQTGRVRDRFFFLCVMWWNILTRGSADSPQGEEEWGGWEKERVQNERKIIRKEGGKQKEMAITTARNRQVI